MKVVDGKLKVASENPQSLNPKGFQVIEFVSPSMLTVVCIYYLNTFDMKLLYKLCQMQSNL